MAKILFDLLTGKELLLTETADGTSGEDGTSGVDGTSGTSGIDGENGTSGIDGTSGSSGTSGISGEDGISGVDAITTDYIPKKSTEDILVDSNLSDDGVVIKLHNSASLVIEDSIGLDHRYSPDDQGNLIVDGEYWYGIEYDVTVSSPTVTRIASNMNLHKSLPAHESLKTVLLNDDLSVNYYLNPTDWSKKLDGSNSVLDGTDGQVMVRKTSPTYWKFESDGNIRRVKVSTTPQYGFNEIPIWNISAYEAALQRSTLKLSSVVNSDVDYRGGNNTSSWDSQSNSLLGKPATNINRTNFRVYAENRGIGWYQLSYRAYAELVWLFVIEYGTFNSQLPVNINLTAEGYKQGGLGNGVTTASSSDWSNFNSYNPFINCGASDSLGSSSGEVEVDISDFGGSGINETFTVNRYRGIENPFGHIWKWVDGVNIYNSTAYIIENPTDFADNTSDNSRNAGTITSNSGWITELLNNDKGDILSSTVGGSNSTYMCDYAYIGSSTTTWYALWVGGRSINGSYTGLFSANSNVGASTAGTRIGGRLYAE